MPVVQNTLTDVAGAALANTLVQARLVGSTTDPMGGFDTGDKREIGGWLDVRTNAAGKWTLNLEPTVAGDLSPVGAYVEILEHFPGTAPLRHTISVPTSVGPHWLYDLLIDPLSSLPPSALGEHIIDAVDAHDASAVSFAPASGIAATNVQAAVVEAKTDAEATATAFDALALHKAGAESVTGVKTFEADAYFQSGRPWVDVRAFGAVGDGIADDTAAIQAALNAIVQPTGTAVTAGGVNGGFLTAGGGTVFMPPGIYKTTATLTVPSYIRLVGSHYRTTIIRRMDAGATPIFTLTDSRWVHLSDFSVETNGVGVAGQTGFAFTRTGTFGIKFTMERIATYQCYDAVTIDGDTTASSIRDMYIRNPAQDGFRQISGSLSTCSIGVGGPVYVSNPGRHGFNFATGGGNCDFGTLIAESTGVAGDGFRANGLARTAIDSLYLGDSVGRNGMVLERCSDLVVDALYCSGAATGQSAIVLDGSYRVQINVPSIASAWSRYLVEWKNTVATAAYLLSPNHIGDLGTYAGAVLGLTNDAAYLDFVSVVDAPDRAFDNTSPFRSTSVKSERFGISAPAVPAYRIGIGSKRPNLSQRWEFLASFPGCDDFGIFSTSDGVLAVFPLTETLGTSKVTGDSSTFAAGVGSWVVGGGGSALASVVDPVTGSGNVMRITANGSSANLAKLQVTGLTSGRLVKVTMRSLSGTVPRAQLRVYAANESTLLRDSEYVAFATVGIWQDVTLYVEPTGTSIWLYILGTGGIANGQTVYIDDVLVKEVSADGSLKLTGGRKFSAGEAGGGTLGLYGFDHATKPGWSEVKNLHVDVVATASLPAAGATQDGRILIEDGGAGVENIVTYKGGQRFRHAGTAF